MLQNKSLFPGPLKNEIVDGLNEVGNWQTLASQLGFTEGEINSIDQNCARSVQSATCCQRELVKRLCMSEVEQGDAFKRLVKALEKLKYFNLAKRFKDLLLPQPSKIKP